MANDSHYLPPDAGPADIRLGTRDRFGYGWQAANVLFSVALGMVMYTLGIGVLVVAILIWVVLDLDFESGAYAILAILAVGGLIAVALHLVFLPLFMGHSVYTSWLARRQRAYFPPEVTVLPVQIRTNPRFTPPAWRWLDDAEDVGCLAVYPDRLHFHGDWIDMIIWRESQVDTPILRADRIGLWLVKNDIRFPLRSYGELTHVEFSDATAVTLPGFIRSARHARTTLTGWHEAGAAPPLPSDPVQQGTDAPAGGS